MYSGICRQFSFKLSMMMQTAKLYILVSVLMTFDLHSRSQLYETSKTLVSFSCKFRYWFVGLWKLMCCWVFCWFFFGGGGGEGLKSCKYGQYESFEHLLFLIFFKIAEKMSGLLFFPATCKVHLRQFDLVPSWGTSCSTNLLSQPLNILAPPQRNKRTDRQEADRMFVGWLVAYRPSNMRVYLGDGSAQTILRAATLR